MYLRSICLFAVSLPVLAQTIPSTTSEPATGIPQLETGVPQPAAGIEQPAERIQLKPATGISALLRDDSARLLYERPGEYSMDERVRDYVNSLISPGHSARHFSAQAGRSSTAFRRSGAPEPRASAARSRTST